ncbi:MAG: polysaccharide biosynthesis protein [Bacteroidia bacterium]
MKLIALLFERKSSLPRWFVFMIDVSICAVSYIITVFFRTAFEQNYSSLWLGLKALPLVLLIKSLLIYYYKLYAGILRHTSVHDGINILYAMLLSGASMLMFDAVFYYFYPDMQQFIPFPVILLDFIISVAALTSFRLIVRLLYIQTRKNNIENVQNFAVYGAGEAGLVTKKKLEEESRHSIKVVAFFDDSPNKHGKYVQGVRIYNGLTDFEEIVKKHQITTVVIAIPSLGKVRKHDIIEACLNLNIIVRSVPPVDKWINGELTANQIKHAKIEDLIDRDVIELDINGIATQLHNKVVLVSGAGGSIGSEIVNQITSFKPKKLICLDKSEIKLYELESALAQNKKTQLDTFIDIVIGDITNVSRMRMIFEKYKPDIIYHAAAYKHVPLMEENPSEAVWTNVNGTKTLADLAVEYKVSKFVMVSTDKAVNPTNVMGASKRIAEIYVQSLNNHIKARETDNTKFITTRFGNVLGSSGSVIPRFRKQIEEGGPITVTHPDITRYFMTIPEACQLVLEAGHMGKGGEIYIFDMGKPVKIVDLAKKMVKLSGLTLGKDIQLVFSGLRPGEKIYEELLNDKENTLPTHHNKIMIGKVIPNDYEDVKVKIEDLIDSYKTQDEMKIVSKMKSIVPEFRSKNSIFESLDVNVELPDRNQIEKMLLSE